MTTNQTAPVSDEELDQMIWKLERDGMTPKQLSLMRELREVRRAKGEPVGYFYADKPGDWYQISDGDRVPSHRRIPLYANPQSSPVVKLPNEFISNEGIVVQIEKVMAVLALHGIQYERRGNACRAAMLQSDGTLTNEDAMQLSGNSEQLEPVSNRDELNSPVTPDGWIPVSEQMPDKDGNYWGWWSESKRQGPVWFIKSELQAQFQSSEITHWMPLPEPPMK